MMSLCMQFALYAHQVSHKKQVLLNVYIHIHNSSTSST